MEKPLNRAPAALALKTLRERSGVGLREMAAALGMSSSSYGDYERIYKKQYQPVPLMKRIAPLLEGKGVPPVTRDEVLALAGIGVDFVDNRPAHDSAGLRVNDDADLLDKLSDEEFFRIWGRVDDDVKIAILVLLKAALRKGEAA